MSDAPETIWASTGLYYDYVTDWTEGEWSIERDWGVEYRRADLPPPDPIDDPRVKALVEALGGMISYSEMAVFATDDPVKTALDALAAMETDSESP